MAAQCRDIGKQVLPAGRKGQLLRLRSLREAQFESNGIAYPGPCLALRASLCDREIDQRIGGHIVLRHA